MNVRAKFKVDAVTRSLQSSTTESQTIHLSPVTGYSTDSEENKAFWKYTPNGKIELTCINKAAGDAFELGKEYYVDFTPAASV